MSSLLALDPETGSAPARAPREGEATPALRTAVAVLGILLALSSDERWSVALVEADLLPTLVRVALLSRRAGAEAAAEAAQVRPAATMPREAEEAEEAAGMQPGEAGAAAGPPSSGAVSAGASEASGTTLLSEVPTADGARARLVWDALSLSVGVLANVLDAAAGHVGDSLLELREFLFHWS